MRIGVDLGGTKIEAIALARDGGVVERVRVATPSGSYDDIVRAVAELVRVVEARVGQAGSVGVGIPGTVSASTGLVKNANTTVLNGRPLDRDLGRALEREVRVANDANCFTLSEASDGAAAYGADTARTAVPDSHARSHVVFGVIIGTGTGAGVVVNGRPLVGVNGIAGEWGHNPLPWQSSSEYPGPKCWCGQLGCIETFLSGPGLAKDHERNTQVLLSAAQIAAASASGDQDAMASLSRYESRLARGLASIINVLDPDVIVLGGGVSNIERLYNNVPLLWSRYVFSDTVNTRLVQAKHGDSSGVRGAAWLWP